MIGLMRKESWMGKFAYVSDKSYSLETLLAIGIIALLAKLFIVKAILTKTIITHR